MPSGQSGEKYINVEGLECRKHMCHTIMPTVTACWSHCRQGDRTLWPNKIEDRWDLMRDQ